MNGLTIEITADMLEWLPVQGSAQSLHGIRSIPGMAADDMEKTRIKLNDAFYYAHGVFNHANGNQYFVFLDEETEDIITVLIESKRRCLN